MANRAKEGAESGAEGEHAFLLQARDALGATAGDLAKHLDVSSKTAWRWLNRHTSIGPLYLGKLALVVHAHDADLATRMHEHARRHLERLRLPGPPPLPTAPAPEPPLPGPAPPPVLPLQPRVDAVVYAASCAADLSPRAMLPALAAAVRRALELDLTIADLDVTLSPPSPAPPSKKKLKA